MEGGRGGRELKIKMSVHLANPYYSVYIYLFISLSIYL